MQSASPFRFLDIRPLGLAAALMLSGACGGGSDGGGAVGRLQPVSTEGVAQFAFGPIQSACKANHRTRASSARCGCIQAAANLTLSPDEQKRGAGYFNDPEVLQQMKLSDSAANERMWYRWERFAETAEKMCEST